MKKYLVITSFLFVLLSIFFAYDYLRFYDGKLHIVFCNVGQGDGFFIRTPDAKNILIDAGPDKSILTCLSSHMPFWERTIHKMILSHPHDDHFFGMQYVIQRYNTLTFDTEDLFNSTASFHKLMLDIVREKAVSNRLYRGNFLNTNSGVRLSVLGPTRKLLDEISPNRQIAERGEQASLIQHLKYKDFDLFFASDNDAEVIDSVFSQGKDPIEVLQVPHHGSRFGLSSDLLKKIDPKVAVISVGKNKYGHPHPQTLKLLKDNNIRVFRTDEMGDIEIITDGRKWQVRR